MRLLRSIDEEVTVSSQPVSDARNVSDCARDFDAFEQSFRPVPFDFRALNFSDRARMSTAQA